MRFVIVTGMSGAGKSSALKMLEDVGYFCVDNLPVALLDKFAEMLLDKTAKIENAALGIDIRNGEGIGELEQKMYSRMQGMNRKMTLRTQKVSRRKQQKVLMIPR